MPLMPKRETVGGDSVLVRSSNDGNGRVTRSGDGVVRVDLAASSKNNINPELLQHAADVSTLTLDPMNARLHPEENLQAIMESLAVFGQVKPVVVRRETGVVMAGNGTLAAALRLGWMRVAAVRVSMTDAQAAGYGLADNRTAELAKWNLEVVGAIDAMLKDAGVPTIGWGPAELLAMRKAGWVEPPEDFPEVDEGIETDHECPRCQYRWSGGDVVKKEDQDAVDAED